MLVIKNSNDKQPYNIKVKASKPGKPTTGEIIVKKNGKEKVINAVIFPEKEANRLLEIANKMYSGK